MCSYFVRSSLSQALQQPFSSNLKPDNGGGQIFFNTTPTSGELLKLPDDVLMLIFRALMHGSGSAHDASCVDASGYASALSLAQACKALNKHFYLSVDALTLPSLQSLTDTAVDSLARNLGSATLRIVLRSCPLLTDAAAISLSQHMTSLRSVDFSFLKLTDDGLLALLNACGPSLETLLLRECTQLTDRSLHAISKCVRLESLDVSRIGESISDSTMSAICEASGSFLRLLGISLNPNLSDGTFRAIGRHCSNLKQLCARNLPLVTNAGFNALCIGVGKTIRGLDVLDCTLLTKNAVLRSIQEYCIHIELTPTGYFSLRYVALAHSLINSVIPTTFQLQGMA